MTKTIEYEKISNSLTQPKYVVEYDIRPFIDGKDIKINITSFMYVVPRKFSSLIQFPPETESDYTVEDIPNVIKIVKAAIICYGPLGVIFSDIVRVRTGALVAGAGVAVPVFENRQVLVEGCIMGWETIKNEFFWKVRVPGLNTLRNVKSSLGLENSERTGIDCPLFRRQILGKVLEGPYMIKVSIDTPN